MQKNIYIIALLFFLLGCSEEDTKVDQNTTLEKDAKVDQNTTLAEEKSNNPIEVQKGQKLFNLHCATCHGSGAKGATAPNIVGITAIDIENEILSNSAMVFMQGVLNDEDRRVMAVYFDEQKKYSEEVDELYALKANLGNKLFDDTILSKNQTLSCASCHNPERAFIDDRFDTNPVDGALSVGDDGVTLGGRNAPTISYGKFIPDFLQISDTQFIGGQFWDSRAKNQKEQAKGPVLDHAEMMMPDITTVINRIQNSPYKSEFQKLYTETIFNDETKAFDALADALAKYEKSKEFAPFDSKYDRSKLPYYHIDHYEMSEQEKLGYKLFFSDKTHCRKCHTTSSETESSIETFTNSKYENIGIAKNTKALLYKYGNTDTTDLGLGAILKDKQHNGKFKVPTLRNVAVTSPYMSNGIFKELKTVIRYFNYRAGNPEPINPETGESWAKPEVNATINHEILDTLEPLNETEIEALESFLKLLTDKKYEKFL